MGTESCLAYAYAGTSSHPYVGDMDAMKKCFFFYYTFHYEPMQNIAYMHAGFFAVVTLLMMVLTLRNPSKHMWIIVATGVAEVAGYILRAVAAEQQSLGLFIAQTLLLLMAPIALALVNYVVIGQLLEATGKKVWCFTPRMVSRLFLASDVLTFLIQGGGGGIMAIEGLYATGQPIVLLGLALQIAFFATFTAVVAHVSTHPSYGLSRVPSLKPVLRGVLVTVGLMFVRNTFRVAEFAGGQEADVVTKELYFWLFETLPIWLSFCAYAYWHFGALLPMSPTATWRGELAVALEGKQAVVGAGEQPATQETHARVSKVVVHSTVRVQDAV